MKGMKATWKHKNTLYGRNVESSLDGSVWIHELIFAGIGSWWFVFRNWLGSEQITADGPGHVSGLVCGQSALWFINYWLWSMMEFRMLFRMLFSAFIIVIVGLNHDSWWIWIKWGFNKKKTARARRLNACKYPQRHDLISVPLSIFHQCFHIVRKCLWEARRRRRWWWRRWLGRRWRWLRHRWEVLEAN